MPLFQVRATFQTFNGKPQIGFILTAKDDIDIPEGKALEIAIEKIEKYGGIIETKFELIPGFVVSFPNAQVNLLDTDSKAYQEISETVDIEQDSTFHTLGQ